jgi:RNA methyltransferase, TrmH family
LATEKWAFAHQSILSKYASISYQVTDEQLAQISSLKNHSEVLIVAKQKLNRLEEIASTKGGYFYLDNIQDPGNVGTIIRLADWFGFKGVIASSDTADFFHPKVVQSTMGSICGPMLIEAPVEHLASYRSLFNFYAMDMNGSPLQDQKLSDNTIFILGNEGHGLSIHAKQLLASHEYLTIMGSKTKKAESLNVGIAAGIVANHFYNR